MRIINLRCVMKPHEEIVRNSPGLSFCYQDRDEPLSFDWHYHREFELTYVVDGRGTRFVGDDVSQFDSGDLVLVGPLVPHAFESSNTPAGRGYRTIIIQFSPSLFAADRQRLKELRHIHRMLKTAETGLAFDLATSMTVRPLLDESAGHSGLEKLIDLMRVLDLLAKTGRWSAIVGEEYRRDSSSIDPDEPREDGDLLQFIFASACGPLTLAAVSAHAGLSVTSLCRHFKRKVGCTFNEYVTRIRISQACKLLIQTDLPIYSIAYRAGFENLSNFNRRFLRAKGMTPSSYRRRHESRSSESPRLRRAGGG